LLKVVLVLVLVFCVLLVLRALRLFLARLLGPPRRRAAVSRPVEGDMVRDPVCGVWIDRRLALPAGPDHTGPPVCSETCRNALLQTGRGIAR
jgi:hypothetical protein